MKKSPILISFAFIFLLSMSVVSASLLSDLFYGKSTGDATITGAAEGPNCPPEGDVCSDSSDCPDNKGCTQDQCGNWVCTKRELGVSTAVSSTSGTFSKTPGQSSSSARTSNRGSECPRGWNTLLAKDGGNCCRKAENKGRSGLFGLVITE